MPAAEHDDGDRDESAPGRHSFGERASLCDDERRARRAAVMPPKTSAAKRTRFARIPAASAATWRFADGAQRETRVRSIHPPPRQRKQHIRDVRDDGLIEQARPDQRNVRPIPGIGVGPSVGIESAAPDAPYSVRYSVPVRPTASSVTAVPVMIWSARSRMTNTANTIAIATPAATPATNPPADAESRRTDERAERAGENHAFETDVDDSRALDDHFAERRERQRRRGAHGGFEKRGRGELIRPPWSSGLYEFSETRPARV